MQPPAPSHVAIPDNGVIRATGETISGLKNVPRFVRLTFRVLLGLRRGTLTIRLPSGEALCFTGKEPGENAEIVIHDFGIARRFLSSGNMGAAEAYLDGMWDSPRITSFLKLFVDNKDALSEALAGNPLMRIWNRLRHLLRRNTRSGSKKNIEFHYDLGNAFYSQWLDPTMTYSSARYEYSGQSLADAQTNKYRSLADLIDLKPEHSVLEIGSGWGGFAEYAAGRVGCRVTGITISREQLTFARERMKRCGLDDRVEIRYQDYREVSERFDRIASIEMFEAVGEEYWPTYFQKIRDCLKPGGLAGLQIITIDEKSFDAYRRSADFIQRYIFPGGMLPSPTALREHTDRAGLKWVSETRFGLDYATTLAEWRDRFQAAWPEIRKLGFDDRFRRMWEYYLAYCEAGFLAGNINVTQVTLARP